MKISILTLIFVLSNAMDISAQLHTFTKNKGEYRDTNTGQSVKSNDIDNITIEILEGGLYKFSDLKDSKIFRYSHIEDSLYVYNLVDGKSLIKSYQKLSSFANGIPGKLKIYLAGTSIILIYWLDN